MAAGIGDSGPDKGFGASTTPKTWGPASEVLPPLETQLPPKATLFERVHAGGERIRRRVKEFMEEFTHSRIEF